MNLRAYSSKAAAQLSDSFLIHHHHHHHSQCRVSRERERERERRVSSIKRGVVAWTDVYNATKYYIHVEALLYPPTFSLFSPLFSIRVCIHFLCIYPSVQCYPQLFLHSVRVCTSLCWMLPAACAWKQHNSVPLGGLCSVSLFRLLLLVVLVMMGGGRSSNTHTHVLFL